MFHLQLNKLNRLIRRLKKVHGEESGQSVILVSVVILSFLMFFGFAINVGLLVTAKISLQNAADAAAYAGAATQARQLNAISYLNYDMRRQYKKFLFRYVFVGSLGSPKFPDNIASGSTNGDYDFTKYDYSTGNKTAIALKVPAICIPLTSSGVKNDNCLQVNIPNTANDVKKAFPGGGLTQITQKLLEQINQIQDYQNKICQSQGSINLFVLLQWLFRGDTDPATLTNMMTNMFHPGGGALTTDETTAINTVKALVQDLGLYPRNILNLMRIETVEGFLNTPPLADVDQDKIKSLEAPTLAEANERTIQAFKSAIANLNAQVMNPTDVTLTELQSAQQFKTEPLYADFNAYVQMMDPKGAPTMPNVTCSSSILNFPAIGAPVGVKRATSPGTTHYAVKLKAKVKLLFLPIKDGLELEAVSAAKPFGSRIGPQNISPDEFIDPNRAPPMVAGMLINDCTGGAACKSPNLKLGGSNTYYSVAYLKAIMDIARNGQATYGYDGITKALAHATSPSPVEVGHYNILPPAKSLDEMYYEFIPYSMGAEPADPKVPGSVYRFYAPLYPAGVNNTSERVKKLLGTMFATTSVSGNKLGFNEETMRNDLQATITGYITKLDQADKTAEHQESTTFAAIELPMRNPQGMTPNKNFWLTEAKEVLSSWGPQYIRSASGLGFTPRFGYSVKFVTMQNLLAAGMPDNDGDLGKVSH